MDGFGGQVKESIDSIIQKAPHLITTEKKKRIAASFQQLQEENKSLKGEKKNLKNRIDEETDLIQTFKDQADGLKRILGDKEVEINALNQTIKEQTENLLNLKDKLENETKLKKEVISKLEEESKIKTEVISKLGDETKEKERLLDVESKLSHDLNISNLTVEQQSDELAKLKEKLEQEEMKLAEEIRKHKENVESLSAEIEKNKETIDEYTKQCTSLTSQISVINTEMDGLQQTINGLNQKLNDITNERDNLAQSLEDERLKLSELENLHSQLKQSNQELISSLEAEINLKKGLEEQLTEANNKQQQLEQTNQEQQSNNEKLEKQLESELSLKQSLENQMSEVNIKLNELNRLATEEKERIQQLQIDLEGERSSKNSLELKLSDMKQKYDELDKLISTEQTRNEQLESDRTVLTSEKDSLQKDVEGLREDLNNRNNQINELTMLRTTLTMEIEGVRKSHIKEMEELTEELTTAQETLTTLNAEIENLNKEKNELQSQSNTLQKSNDEQRVELDKQKLIISQLESNLQEKTTECLSLNRTQKELEYLKETLKQENQSIRDMISQNKDGLDQRLAEKDEYLKNIHSLELKSLEQNNQIEDLNRNCDQYKERISTLSAELEKLNDTLESEKKKREEDANRFSNDKESLYNQHLKEQLEKEEAAELVITDLKAIADKANNDRDIMEKELINFAQRLSGQSEKIHEYEKQITEQQKEIESIIHTRDNLIKELEELQSKQLDGASRESEERLIRELNDLKLRYEDDKSKLQKQHSEERTSFESRRWEIVAELEQEKNRNRKIQEELLEERRRLGVVSKTVEKFLNEDVSDQNITLESFYAMLEAAKKELLDGFHHKKHYYDDEDLLAQLHMEREARRLAESQVEHFAVLLEKMRVELNTLKSKNGQPQTQAGFFSNLARTFKEYNSDETYINPNNGTKNFLKRTFTGTTTRK